MRTDAGELLSDPVQVANELAAFLFKTSRVSQDPAFLCIVSAFLTPDFVGEHEESYNKLLPWDELENVLRNSSHIAPGEDRNTYSMICHCPEITKQFLLPIINKYFVRPHLPH